MHMVPVREAAQNVSQWIADAADADLEASKSFGLRLPRYGLLEDMGIVGLDMSKGILEQFGTDFCIGGEVRACRDGIVSQMPRWRTGRTK